LWILNNATTISASSDSYSNINPSGSVNVNYSDNQTFNYSGKNGGVITQVLVDGSQVPITGSYTFTNVQSPHTILVFSNLPSTPTPSPTATQTATPTTTSTTTPTTITTSTPITTSPNTPPQNQTNAPTTSTAPKQNPLEGPIIFIVLAAFLTVSLATFSLHKQKVKNPELKKAKNPESLLGKQKSG